MTIRGIREPVPAASVLGNTGLAVGAAMPISFTALAQWLVKSAPTGTFLKGTAAATGGTPADGEIPGGTINGINAAFSLAHIPLSGSVHLFVNGLRTISGYSVTGAVLTYTGGAIPNTGDNHVVDYRY